MEKSKRGLHPNSLKALQENRQKALQTNQKKKEIRLMQEEIKKEQKRRQTLNLELEVFKIKQKKEQDRECQIKYEEQFYPLSNKNLFQIIENVFSK